VIFNPLFQYRLLFFNIHGLIIRISFDVVLHHDNEHNVHRLIFFVPGTAFESSQHLRITE